MKKTELMDIADKLEGLSCEEFGWEIVEAEKRDGGHWSLTIKRIQKTEDKKNDSDE